MEKNENCDNIIIPDSYNYIGLFLTFACNLSCSYCINRFNSKPLSGRLMSGAEWVKALNRLVARSDLPISLQGGEPTLHPDFFDIVNGIKPELHIDLLTNLEFDKVRFMREISPKRMRRNSPYSSIRVSYHPESMEIKELAEQVKLLLDAGYHIGIWGVEHPRYEQEIAIAKEYCRALGIDFRTKDFLGEYDGKMYGNLSFQDACDGKNSKRVQCKTTELLIGPGGEVFRCHADLYKGENAIGHILDSAFVINDVFRSCNCYGHCNPCDVKLKNNRFQEFGHTSVEIIKSGSLDELT